MFSILPKAVVNDLLTRWITLPCVGKLDSALCSKQGRLQFFTFLESGLFVHDSNQSCGSEVFYDWILKRKMKLHATELVLDEVLLNNRAVRCKVLSMLGKKLTKLSIDSPTATTAQLERAILDVALHCTNLTTCNINRYTDLSITSLLARNPNMEKVTLHECISPKESEILHSIGLLCLRIRAIDLRAKLADHSFRSFLSDIPVTLQSLCLRNCNKFTWPALLDVLQQCRDLFELRIGNLNHNSPDSLPVVQYAGMRTFRVQLYDYSKNTIDALAQLMPRLTTALLMWDYKISYTEGARRIVLNFPYLRQLVTIPECEDCLQCLQTDTQEHDIDSHPVPGSRLEELYDYASIDYVSKTELPALRAVGCKNVNLLPVLPPHVKKFVLVRNITMQNDLMIPNLCGLEEIVLRLYHSISNQTMRRVSLQNPHLKVLCVEQVVYGQSDVATISAEGLWIFLALCPLLHTVEYRASRHGQTLESPILCPLLRNSLFRSFPNLKNLVYSAIV